MEKLKDNIVNAATLFVGIGGTGSRIVCKVANKCQPGELENMNFVCLDTNVNDLAEIQRKCKTYVYTVQTSTTQTVGDYLDYDRDALKNWFPKNAVMYDKTVSEGAGQVRAISRLALNSTIKTGRIRPIFDAIDELYRKDGKNLKQAIRICFVSTTSGGTGSGSVLPLAMYIRDYIKNKYPQSGSIIRMMLLLPETLDSVITSEVERESQRSNAYATVKEINAFMMKGSGFFDIEGPFARYKDLHITVPVIGSNEQRKLALLPCDWCFLFDGQNAEDNTLVNKGQYEEQAAQALYEQNVGPMMGSAFSVEDNIVQEISKPENSGRNRFAGIGASVLRYPYDDVAEYVAYNWTVNNIGGDGEAAKWTKYDQEFKVKVAEAKKKGLVGEDAPKIAVEYCLSMEGKSETDPFTKEIFDTYLGDAETRLDDYYLALANYMHDCIFENTLISEAREAATVQSKPDYRHDENLRKEVQTKLDQLRNYQNVVTGTFGAVSKMARSVAEALFSNETKTVNVKEPYMIESVLQSISGDICHPNAIRYLLYKVYTYFLDQKDAVASTISEKTRLLEKYSENADNKSNEFDAAKTKAKETTIDALVNACLTSNFDQKAFDRLNGHFMQYFKTIEELAKALAEQAAYERGFDFVKEVSIEFEKFFQAFPEKVKVAERRRGDIVDNLRFQKGDSLLNVCASKEVLDELTMTTIGESSEGESLVSDLNGAIFDAIKANVAFNRRARLEATLDTDERVDIFDDIMIGYFLKQVRSQCRSIDMNIVEAIAMEQRMLDHIRQREENKDLPKDEKLYKKISAEESEAYICNVIERGKRLAAPGIQKMMHEEPRTIECCAYNKSLEDMRAFRVKDLIEIKEQKATDSVSKYEMHFFNAIYNIRPDKLKKFAPDNLTETGAKNAGLYHSAYVKHSEMIGPDSTKNAIISKHIDKRWDSIAVMPEIDDGYQYRHMIKIHQAMVYGLIYNLITSRKVSPVAGQGRRVYRYENTDERFVNLTVSNGTMCDEFFEILDSLYISSAIVEDVKKAAEKKRINDSDHNANYCDTEFARCVKEFTIQPVCKGRTGHEGVASLFEIPLYYYNSLPNAKRYNDEIMVLVDAVIKTLRDEINTFENANDAKFVLSTELVDQFNLMMEHYESMPNLRNNLDARDNPVLDIIYRKIKAELSTEPQPENFDEKLEAMRARIRTVEKTETGNQQAGAEG